MSYRRRKRRSKKNRDSGVQFGFERLSDKTNRHHRKPKSKGGDWSKRNISVISQRMHAAWHVITQNFNPQDIVRILNEINKKYLDPDYELIVVFKENDKILLPSLQGESP